MATLPEKLTDKPSFTTQGFGGYFHHEDPTIQSFNKLTYPSRNCSIPTSDKVIPDKGKTLLGQAFTENVPIIGHKEKFKNMGGLEMETRVWKSANVNLADVVEIYYTNDKMLLSGVVGVFQIGETITGAISGATGIISAILTDVLTLTNITGTFVVGEVVTGASSGATGTIVTVPVSTWHQITENINPLPLGLHEYYFDEWFDTNVDPSLTRRLPRLIWVNGYTNTGVTPNTGLIMSWTGGVALVTATTATDIIIDASLTWRSLGFSETAAGTAFVVVNGVSYQLATPADLDTNSIDVTSTVGVSVGDIATARIETDVSPIPFDMCRMNKNYMFYGNWTSRDLYQSNNFNRPPTLVTQTYNSRSGLNDAVFSGTYTGTVEHTYTITISSTALAEQQFIAGGSGGLNDAFYDFSTYSGATGVINIYKTLVVADFTILVPTAGGAYQPGEVVQGATSNAEGIFVGLVVNGLQDQMAIKMLSGSFVVGENIVGLQSTTTKVAAFVGYQTWIEAYKNEVLLSPTSGPFTGTLVPILTAGNIALNVDNISITFGNFYGHAVGDIFQLTIRQPWNADQFVIAIDGQPVSAPIQITGAAQVIADGISVTFGSLTGHEVGDTWTATYAPGITRAWADFYYNLPIRKPGEGYIYRLPSNFWTMDTQEESMYVNGSYGEWGFIQTVLSGDLRSEDVSLTPLKQAGASKVLYPYLTGHLNDDLIYVTVDKNLDTLGRKIYMEKPQTGYLSDPVRLDFVASSFVGGRLKYLEKKIYISSPEQGIMHCFDTFEGYWQPPKVFPELGILSIFGNELVSHSNVRNQSFTVFTSTNGDNGFNYEVVIRTSYTSLGDKWQRKYSNMSFTEGYIDGSPPLEHKVFLGINGCKGIFDHPVEPIVCISQNNAPLGEGPHGSHPLGSDIGITGNYFQEVFKSYSPVLDWRLLAIELSCITANHSYQILSLGMNATLSNAGNNDIVNPNNKVI